MDRASHAAQLEEARAAIRELLTLIDKQDEELKRLRSYVAPWIDAPWIDSPHLTTHYHGKSDLPEFGGADNSWPYAV